MTEKKEWKVVTDSTECGSKEMVCEHDRDIGQIGYNRCGILKDYCQRSACPLRVERCPNEYLLLDQEHVYYMKKKEAGGG